MDQSVIVAICLGIPAAVISVLAFWASTRANRVQDEATVVAVDAAAYDRAKGLYEASIKLLQDQVMEFRTQVKSLEGEVTKLRNQSASLESEVVKLRMSNYQLSQELANFR
jgi:chromosome segregation ATPase